jgi:CRISP-associated protein Cas1
MQLLNTLYVTQPESYLRLDNNTLRIEIEKEVKLQVPLHHLCSVVCFGRVGISAPLMHRLADESIALVLLDGNGRFKARLEGATAGNVLLRKAQHKQADNLTFALELARSMIAGKIKNARNVLQRGARDAKNADDIAVLERGVNDLAASLRSLPAMADLDAVRGVEGDAARKYFGCINQLIRTDLRTHFYMDGRNRRPPRDRMNALLSFIYAMWMNDCRSAVEAAGLDPQIGFLHAVRPGRAALALDLQEEFRPLADRLALTLVNRGQLDAGDFIEREGGAVAIEGDARKAVVVAYQERKQEMLTHPLLAQPVPLGVIPMVQARLLARAIRGETAGYLPFILK